MFSFSQGKYAEAEPLYARSQAIREKTLGPDHPDVATVLNGRATLLMKQVGPGSRTSIRVVLSHCMVHNNW